MQTVPGATFRGGAATRVHAPYVSEAGGRVGVAFPVGVSPVLRFGNEVQFYVADVHVCKKCLPIILPTFVV